MYLFSFHICTHLFVCTWNIWICLPVFIKSNRSKPWKKQSSSTHLPSFRGHISFMSVTPAATGTFVLWIVHIRITHVYAFRDWKVPAWRKHAEPKLREKKRAWNPARSQGPVILSFRLLIPWSLQCWALEIWLFFPRKSWKFRSYYPR